MSAFEVTGTPYGLRIAFKGFPNAQDVANMTGEMERLMATLPSGWGILVDMLDNKAFSPESAAMMKAQIGACKRHGMQRAAVILQSAVVALQARRIATEGGIIDIIRFLDAGSDPEWEKRAVAWITHGTEPGT